MKRFIKAILLSVASVLGTFSCDDYVDIDPLYSQDADNYFNSPADYDRALTGAYDLLQTSYLTLWIGEIASDNSIAGGESPNVVAERMRRGIAKILNGPGETVLVCMHGRAMRIFLSLILNYDMRYMDQFEHNNLCLYLLEQLPDYTFVVRKFNDQEHLKALSPL